MKPSRRILAIILIAFSLFAIAGCSEEEETINTPTEEELIASQYDELTTALGEQAAGSDIASYVYEWAEQKNITARKTDSGAVILTKNPTKGYTETKDIVLTYAVGEGSMEEEMQPLATLLFTFSNITEHPKTHLVIFEDEKIQDLPFEISESEKIIHLEYSKDDNILTGAAAADFYKITKSISYDAPRYDQAYKISIRNLSGGKATHSNTSKPNPILTIAKFMAGLKSNGFLYDIGAIKGGISAERYPEGVSAVVVIPKQDMEKFEKRLEKSISQFEKKWSDKEEEYEYTYTKIKVPDTVLAPEDADSVVSLLYTMISGPYSSEEEDNKIKSFTNIGKISTSKVEADIRLMACSTNMNTLKDMRESIRTLSKISEFKSKVSLSIPLWNDTDSPLSRSISENTDLNLKDAITYDCYHPCSKIRMLDEKAMLISIGTSFDNWSDVSKELESYLKAK